MTEVCALGIVIARLCVFAYITQEAKPRLPFLNVDAASMVSAIKILLIPILNQLSTNQVKFPLLIQFTYVRNSILGVMLCVHVIHFLITRRPSRCV